MLKTVSSITNAIGALNYKGTWDANANSPALTSSVGTKGDYYVVGTAGSTNLNGISNWGIGDWAAFNGSVWQRVEGGANLNGVDLSVSGTSTLSGLTASTALALNANKEVVSVTNTGTGNNVLATAPTLVGDVSISSGNLVMNGFIAKAVVEGSDIVGILSTTTNLQTAYFMGVTSAGENAAASAIGVRKNGTTSRSINAGGTINALGTDYAEYMTKAGDFTIAKGDVVGIDAQGKLTNVFADAVSFVVKSSNPSFVGGDVWGNEDALGLTKPQVPAKREATEEVEAETDEEFAVRLTQYEADKAVFDAALENARQRVDRIAFAGQVPVNVIGAVAGQYIIPTNDNGSIKGEAVSNPTFEQYQMAVGKVIAIEPDGRAKIIVKVA